MKFIDLTGKKYNRLMVKGRAENSKNNKTILSCICDCGNICEVESGNLKNGHTKSCGCLAEELKVILNTKHGQKNNKIYNAWDNMKQRCLNSKNTRYKYYGEREISICKEWENNFQSFYDWAMENGYKEDLTLDRIDNNGNYEPNNCRWITMKEQANNKRSNRIIEFKGETHTLQEWSEILGIGPETISARIDKLGWAIERALTAPLR